MLFQKNTIISFSRLQILSLLKRISFHILGMSHQLDRQLLLWDLMFSKGFFFFSPARASLVLLVYLSNGKYPENLAPILDSTWAFSSLLWWVGEREGERCLCFHFTPFLLVLGVKMKYLSFPGCNRSATCIFEL